MIGWECTDVLNANFGLDSEMEKASRVKCELTVSLRGKCGERERRISICNEHVMASTIEV